MHMQSKCLNASLWEAEICNCRQLGSDRGTMMRILDCNDQDSRGNVHCYHSSWVHAALKSADRTGCPLSWVATLAAFPLCMMQLVGGIDLDLQQAFSSRLACMMNASGYLLYESLSRWMRLPMRPTSCIGCLGA